MFNKIDLSTSCEPNFLSIKSNKQIRKRLTNLIFKSNTFKSFSKFLEKYKNIDNLQTENYKKKEIIFFKEFNNKNINNNNKLP